MKEYKSFFFLLCISLFPNNHSYLAFHCFKTIFCKLLNNGLNCRLLLIGKRKIEQKLNKHFYSLLLYIDFKTEKMPYIREETYEHISEEVPQCSSLVEFIYHYKAKGNNK